jgi:hypothetical protein
MLVTLMEEWQPPVQHLTDCGIESLYVPIPDRMPPTKAQTEATCHAVYTALSQASPSPFTAAPGGAGPERCLPPC